MWQFLVHELIFEILRHFLPGLQLSVSKPHRFPWYLGQICSTWRTVFVSSPQFWSALVIDIDADLDVDFRQERIWHERRVSRSRTLVIDSDTHLRGPKLPPYFEHIFELVRVTLQRSKNHPLSLSVTMHHVFRMDDAFPPVQLAKNILKMLVAHSMYWRNVRMLIHPRGVPNLYGAKGRLPNLRSAKLIVYWLKPGRHKFQDLFMEAPQLTRIYFTELSYWKINWSTVTAIYLANAFSLDETISILRLTGHLEEFVVDNLAGIMDAGGVSPVHLPFLKVLSFPSLLFLSLSHTPALEELYIRNNIIQPLAADLELLRTTFSGYFSTIRNLKKLAISAQDVKTAMIILEEAPGSIQDLSLHGNFISKQLKYIANCPRLHNLKAISFAAPSHEISYLLTTIRGFREWALERGSSDTGNGVGPFRDLALFSLDFVPDKDGGIMKPVKRLKRILEERGIRFTSRAVEESELHSVVRPSFDIP